MKISVATLLALAATPLSAMPAAPAESTSPIGFPVQPGDDRDAVGLPITILEDGTNVTVPLEDFEKYTNPILLPLELEDPAANFTSQSINLTDAQADGPIKLDPSAQCGSAMWGPVVIDGGVWASGRLGMTMRWKVQAQDVDDDIPAMCHRLWKRLKKHGGCSVWGLPMFRPKCHEIDDPRPGHKGLYWQFETSLFCSTRRVQAAWWDATHNRHGPLVCSNNGWDV